MTTMTALRASSYRCVFAGLGMELACYLASILASHRSAGRVDPVSAALGIVGALFLVVGACKIGYDVVQLARGRSPRDAVRWPVGPQQVRLSTATNLITGIAMTGAYFWLCAHRVARFGAEGDIGGGGLLVGGCIVTAIGAAKLAFDLFWHSVHD